MFQYCEPVLVFKQPGIDMYTFLKEFYRCVSYFCYSDLQDN